MSLMALSWALMMVTDNSLMFQLLYHKNIKTIFSFSLILILILCTLLLPKQLGTFFASLESSKLPTVSILLDDSNLSSVLEIPESNFQNNTLPELKLILKTSEGMFVKVDVSDKTIFIPNSRILSFVVG